MINFTKKLMAVFVIALLLINNSLLLLISTAVEEVQKIIDSTKVTAVVETTLDKYVNYDLGNESKGVMLQVGLKTGIKYEEGQEYKAIESTGTLVNMPKINEEYPERVEVIGISTKATNGGDTAKDWQYVYDAEKGELKIATLNGADDNGNIYSENVENARDEYKVIAYYSKNAYTDEKLERKIDITGKVQEIVSDEQKTKIESEIKSENTVTEDISGLISTRIDTSEIHNGYIKSNKENGTTYRTEYIEDVRLDINYKEIADEIKINLTNSIGKDEEKQRTNDIVYKSTKISKQEVLDKLGEDGKLQILNENGEVLGEINKDTEAGDNGVVEIVYQNEVSSIEINTSKPVNIGTIRVQNTKEIKETVTDEEINKIIAESKIEAVNNVEVKSTRETEKGTEEVTEKQQVKNYEYAEEKETEIKGTETKVEVKLDKQDWTNNVQNDVNFTATLVTNNERYTLYTNPVVEIKLPQEVEKVILGNVSILHDSELSIGKAEAIERDGSKIIRIELVGKQTAYNTSAITSGANIIIPASIMIRKDIGSTSSNVNVSYINGTDGVSGSIDIPVNIESVTQKVVNEEQEVIAYNGITNSTNELKTEVIAKVGTDVLEDGATVYGGEAIQFTVRMTNDGSTPLENVKAVYKIPEGLTYATINEVTADGSTEEDMKMNELYAKDENKETVEIQKDVLNSGELYEESFLVVISNPDSTINVKNEFAFNINNNNISTSELNLVVEKARLSIGIYPPTQEYFDERYSSAYVVVVEKLVDEEIDNATIQLELGKELEYQVVVGTFDSNTYDKDSNLLTIETGKIEDKKVYIVKVSANKFEEDQHSYNVQVKGTISAGENEKYRSNLQEREVKTTYFSIIQTSETEGNKLKAGEEIEYIFTVKNEGEIESTVNVTYSLPEELQGITIEYEYYDFNENEELVKLNNTKDISNSYEEDGEKLPEFSEGLYVPAGESLTIKVKAKVKSYLEQKEIISMATLSGNEVFTVVSNAIKNTILPFDYVEEPEDPDNPDNPDPDNPDNPDPDNPDPDNPNPDEPDDNKYGISGLVWLDSNQDGKRDDSEEKLSGITVKLYNADTNSIVLNDKNEKQIKTTGNNGEYEFDSLEKGNYLVLFEYDTTIYGLTTYKVSGVSEEVNSDVISKEVSIDGVVKNVGLTDTLKISSSNKENIDMGLVKGGKLDFSLKKYVSKITVETSKGTEEYKYDNSQLAKAEIHAKEINGAKVTIEYKIVVTNEGDTAGFVNEILDYKPDGLNFEENLNTGWGTDIEGNLVATQLSGGQINPGDSREITLVLTKEMTKDTMGTFSNAAEIGDVFNVNNLKDIDSTGANRNPEEDDYSTADVIISTKTGVIVNILRILGIIIAIIIAIVLGRFIKNKKLKKVFLIAIVFVSTFAGYNSVQAWRYGSYFDGELGRAREVVLRYSDLGWHIKNGRWQRVHGGNLICISPGWGLCNQADHVYAYYTNEVTNYYNASDIPNSMLGSQFINQTGFKVGTYGNDSGKINTNVIGTNVQTSYLNNNQIVIGPFRGNWEYVNATTINNASYTIDTGGTGNAFVSDADGRFIWGIPQNQDFYITADATVNSVVIKLDLSMNYEYGKYWITRYPLWCRTSKLVCKCKDEDKINQFLSIIEQHEDKKVRTATGHLEWSAVVPKRYLQIEKTDANTGVKLSGAQFSVTSQNGRYSTVITTDGEGIAKIEGLLEGRYTVREITAPNGYNLSLQTNIEQTIDFYYDNMWYGCYFMEFKNKQYGDLQVVKKDQDTGQTIPTAGVKFRVYLLDENGAKWYVKNTYDYRNENFLDDITTDVNQAYVLVTDSSGVTQTLKNLSLRNGSDIAIYYVEEFEIPEDMSHYYEVTNTTVPVSLANNVYSSTVVNFNNKQLYVDLSGYVFEDIGDGKTTTRNDLYDSDGDRLVQGITVRLKDSSNGQVLHETVTNSSGRYEFKHLDIEIAELGHYYIEFEYNGLKYTNVIKNLNVSNGSKAEEKEADRTEFNNSYSSIVGGSTKGNTTTGYSLDQNGNRTNTLTYTSVNGEYKSQLVQNTGYTVGSANGSVTAQNGSVGVTMKADTDTAGYKITWSAGVKEITNINLGIYERPQADMAIQADLDTVELGINGYTHTYNYNGKERLLQQLMSQGVSDIFDERLTSNENYPTSYTTTIYSNYVDASQVTGEGSLTEENKLDFYSTYKLAVKNESSLYMSANEIVAYIDSSFDTNSIESWYIDGNGNRQNITWNVVGTQNGYIEIRTTGISNIKIQNGYQQVIYLRLKKTDEEVASWAGNYALNEEQNVITEITSYSTYQNVGGNNYVTYAAIDRDSAPDNIDKTNVKNTDLYEDDTRDAPVLYITLDEPRTISGYVFEDATDANLLTGHERKGDRKYNASEDGFVRDVTVELIKEDGTLAYTYPRASTNNDLTAVVAQLHTTSDERGYYEFVGVIPGKYYLRFTYGSGNNTVSTIVKSNGELVEVDVQNYKSTIITSENVRDGFESDNEQWYQETAKEDGYSVAVDDWEKRQNINNAMSIINNKTQTDYIDTGIMIKDENGNDTTSRTMEATSPLMDIAIENENGVPTDGTENRTRVYDNLNFGIVERPRQSLEIYKEISYVRLTLANGQVLIDGDPRKLDLSPMQYVTYPEGGILKIELDLEIMQGANLYVEYEIKVRNNSELDYNTKEYYQYGEVNDATAVGTTINKVIDHLDKNIVFDANNSNSKWQIVNINDLDVSKEVKTNMGGNANTLVYDGSDITLQPGNEQALEKLAASKIISTSEDSTYNNYVEILEVSNSTGRFYGEMKDNKWQTDTPGNFYIKDGDEQNIEIDNNRGRSAIVSIVPSTGEDRSYYYYIIGIAALVILIGGIVIIKKKVL